MLSTKTTILQTTVIVLKYNYRLYRVNGGVMRSRDPYVTIPRPFIKQHICLSSAPPPPTPSLSQTLPSRRPTLQHSVISSSYSAQSALRSLRPCLLLVTLLLQNRFFLSVTLHPTSRWSLHSSTPKPRRTPSSSGNQRQWPWSQNSHTVNTVH